MQFQKWPKINFWTGKKFKTARNAISRNFLFLFYLISRVFFLDFYKFSGPLCFQRHVLISPVVLAAFKRPLLNDLFILDCSSKLAFPPVVVINNFGLSKHHSLNKRLKTNSGLVSKAKRIYCALFVCVPRKSIHLKRRIKMIKYVCRYIL